MHGSLSRCVHEELKSLLERFYEGKEKEQDYICTFASKCLSLPTHQGSACRVLTSLPFQFSPSSPLAAMRKPYPMLISMVKVLTKQRRVGLGNLASAKIMLNTLLKEKATQILIQLLLQMGVTYRKQCCLCLLGIQSPVLWETVLFSEQTALPNPIYIPKWADSSIYSRRRYDPAVAQELEIGSGTGQALPVSGWHPPGHSDWLSVVSMNQWVHWVSLFKHVRTSGDTSSFFTHWSWNWEPLSLEFPKASMQAWSQHKWAGRGQPRIQLDFCIQTYLTRMDFTCTLSNAFPFLTSLRLRGVVF